MSAMGWHISRRVGKLQGIIIEPTVPEGRICIECHSVGAVLPEPAVFTVYDGNLRDDEFYLCHAHVEQYREVAA